MNRKLNVIPINSLDAYIKEIDSLSNQTIYFRGENALYKNHYAGAFRVQLTEQGEVAYPYQEMIKSFYQEISYKLDANEKTSFIAFAQHYGIPTNLIDITASPLVALYFSCQPNDRCKIKETLSDEQINAIHEQYDFSDLKNLIRNYFEDWGYVYYFDSFLDITELIDKVDGKNFIDYYFLNTENELLELLPYIQKYKSQFPDQFQRLWKELKRIISFTTLEYSDYDNATCKILLMLFNRENKTINHKHIYESLSPEYIKISLLTDKFDLDVINYIMTIATYIDLEKNFLGDEDEFIAYMPNFLYSPTIEFERGRNQQGKFFYQVYFTYINDVLSFIKKINCYALQNIKYSHTIFQIREKLKILESLDRIGINQKTIWCNFDHTAAYIKEKFSYPH